MSTVTPGLRAEIAQHLHASSGIRLGMVLQDVEQGLTVEQVASSQGIPLDSARGYVRILEEVLSGKLQTTPSEALNRARTYRYLRECNLSPELRSYVISCMHQLAAINPEVSVEKPFRPGTLRDAGTHPARGRKVWIFQANPKRYDLLDFLARPSTQPGIVDDWSLRKFAKDISDGDTVLLWTAGDQAGIYATGTVVGESFMRPRQDWEPEDAPPESPTIHYRLDNILLDHPVSRRDLVNDPVLKDLSVIRQPQGTNFPVTEQQWEALRPLIESPSGTQATPLPPPQRFDPSDDLEWLLRETLWSRTEVEDVLDTLRMRRPQIILAGPPGTGKTWVAERIAQFLTGGQLDAVHIVQFHPSYAYEDFVEGLRPVASDGQVAFKVVPGALIKVADHARQVDHPVVLVIDEMNRANLPSVFGELLYLLEYRDKEISLLDRDRFSLPPKLYVIGTMNTADRSIRSVDTALRRRFDIFECQPRPEILDAYYSRAGNHSEVSGLAEGLRKLNDTLTQHIDHHHTIGHTFFMGKSLTSHISVRRMRANRAAALDQIAKEGRRHA